MLFLPPTLDASERSVLDQIDQLKKSLAYSLPPRRWGGLLRRTTFARAVRGSNSIEGYQVTVDDALAAVEGEEPLDATTETWLAVSGYRLAMTYVLQKAADPAFSVSVELLQSLQFMMLSYDLNRKPGRWRPGAVFVRDEESGTVVYEAPPADLVPPLVDELIGTLHPPSGEVPLLIQAAMAHLNLVMIHPFADGNGRMARCLQTLVLARSGTLSPTFSSIEEYLGRNTREYYDVLAAVGAGSWQPRRDTRPWIRFCLTAHFRQASTLLRRSRQLERIWNELEIEVGRRKLPERCILALVDATTGLRVRNSTYRVAAEVSDGAAARDLKVLVEAGLLVAQGEKRGRYYVAAPTLQELRHRTGETDRVPDPFANA